MAEDHGVTHYSAALEQPSTNCRTQVEGVFEVCLGLYVGFLSYKQKKM